MNRINQLLQDRTKPVLSIYYPAGYPNLNDTTAVLHTLQQKGIDMVEIGIPFSDPMADGPVSRRSSHSRSFYTGITKRHQSAITFPANKRHPERRNYHASYSDGLSESNHAIRL